MKIAKEWLDFLREQYPAGSRIQLTEMGSDPAPIPPGTTGVLEFVDDLGTFHVKWNNGRELGVVIGEDRFKVLPPEPTLLRLYMPLTADFYPRDEWGDVDETGEVWDGRTLMDYEDQILGAMVKNRIPGWTALGCGGMPCGRDPFPYGAEHAQRIHCWSGIGRLGRRL